jgi:hypothetical protein
MFDRLERIDRAYDGTGWRVGSSRLTRSDPRLNPGPDVSSGNFEVVPRLQIEPELRRNSKVLLEPQGRVSGEAAPAMDQLTDARHRHVKVPRELVLAEAEWLHELEAEDLPWRDGIESMSFFHGRSSFRLQW